ncbi:NifB/NifX family molybdenum-iron cluster-binding protein [Clostridium tepidum]|jgi:predicted Fe-Mo cluster-binding NifX family protein|uniref:Diguanylate cyclase n=1 Tax=Clostridium tepidum TaxID=1962263 RepID=A0A1S9I482_9CLOT|nr:NifB/NifX family molybdenum-iron cluster-binding protein [Clostridium tepidum]MCR1933332.1 NifB/NifX family molybdenum-iron cluster-binding protein [Clostridium tepidum]MDU6877493.1 NifB/NifX family molybdenum-iron cluster-binding protein [Clostridium botulinum]OOO62617.1 diguanylate cyclase [Clostridium tepidum]OOO65055.1 diguanylate cyclase [Clostridium tepidum]
MKIAIPTNGEIINQHFGKSKSFSIATIEDNKVVDIKNVSTENLQHNHSGLSNLLVKENVKLVITGGIGQGAYDALINGGLKVIRGAKGTIQDILNQYLKGELEDKKVICNHYGKHN